MVKDETKQISGAFKYRGSANRLRTTLLTSHLITASTGNHAIGLSLAARSVGMRTSVYVPSSTEPAKLDALEAAGAEVTLVRGTYDDCETEARRSVVHGTVFVHSFDDPQMIHGHRTLFKEIRMGCVHPDVVFVPVGGGGLVAAALLEFQGSPTLVIGVEHRAAAAMRESLAAGRRVTLPDAPGGPEGLLVRTVGQLPFDLCRERELLIKTIDDAELGRSMRILWEEAGIRAEGAGAAALAAALAYPRPGCVAVCVVSGGNISDRAWRGWMEMNRHI